MIKVCIRAEGGKNVGLGHIMRCLSLAKAFRRDGHQVCFFSKQDEGIQKVRDENFDVIRLPSEQQETEGFFYGNPAHLVDEAQAMIKLLKEYQIDLLIIDSYNVSKEYFYTLKPHVCGLAYIDDVNKFSYPVDIVINGNITGSYLKYKKFDEKQVLLLGPHYNMIRDEFSNLPPRSVRKKATEIMITTGGADPYDLTGSLLRAMLRKDEFSNIRFNVLIGSGFTNCVSLGDVCKKYRNVFLYANSALPHNQPDIIQSEVSAIMLRSDLAISAGGSTLYELAACGTPAMAVIIADNQEGIVRKMDELGYVISLGWYNQLNEDLLFDKLRDTINNYQQRKVMSDKGQKLVDGNGSERIVQSIIQNFFKNELRKG